MGNAVIYRPAYDAEVEYLESTGTQWIDTGVIAHIGDVLSFDIVTKFSNDIESNTWLTGWYAGELNSVLLGMYKNNIYFTYNLDSNIISVSDGLYDKNHIIYNSPNGIIINDEVVNSSVANTPLTADIDERSLNIFARWATNNLDTTPPTIGYFIKARVYQFKIILNNSLIRDFIPVRVGSVGYMYDKVSKRLFSNAGTGNFVLGNDVSNAVIPQQRCVLYFGNQRSVGFERIYEEYEWLIGDGSAAINTTYNFESEDTINTLIRITELPSSNRFFYVYANDSADFDYTIMGVLFSNGGFQFRPQQNVTTFQVGEKYEISHNLERIKVNDVTIYNTPTQFISVNQAVSVFSSNNHNSSFNFKGGIAYFSISDKINLVPCKLLQSIPAILDGNGIVRQAGECGMWDKVNDVFYGNMASSGSFTVSND